MGNEFDKKYISETLEEAIKREYETRKFNSDFRFDPQSFKLGTKWQQERMYSEEEVNDLLEMLKRSIAEIIHLKYTYKDIGHCMKYLFDCETIIEQFKKK